MSSPVSESSDGGVGDARENFDVQGVEDLRKRVDEDERLVDYVSARLKADEALLEQESKELEECRATVALFETRWTKYETMELDMLSVEEGDALRLEVLAETQRLEQEEEVLLQRWVQCVERQSKADEDTMERTRPRLTLGSASVEQHAQLLDELDKLVMRSDAELILLMEEVERVAGERQALGVSEYEHELGITEREAAMAAEQLALLAQPITVASMREEMCTRHAAYVRSPRPVTPPLVITHALTPTKWDVNSSPRKEVVSRRWDMRGSPTPSRAPRVAMGASRMKKSVLETASQAPSELLKRESHGRSHSIDLGMLALKRVSEAARLNERWEPPDTSIDAITLPLSIVQRYTKKRESDGRSMVVDAGEIVSASTRDLLLHLLLTSDKMFIRAFLLASPYFLEDLRLLQMLVLFYRSPPMAQSQETRLRMNIVTLLETWATLKREELQQSKRWKELFVRFMAYLQRGKEEQSVELGERLRKHWEKDQFAVLMELPVIRTPMHALPADYTEVIDIDPLLMAKQLTLREQQYFHAIPLREYYSLAWTRKDALETAPHLLKIIARFNEDEDNELSAKERSAFLSYWLLVLKALMEMNNYNTALQVYSALNLIAITRLKRTWGAVPRSELAIFSDFSALVENNFRLYRERLEQIVRLGENSDESCIPLHSLLLRDLSMIEEMENFLDEGSVNWEKMALVANTLNCIQTLRRRQYSFREDAAVQTMLWHAHSVSEEELQRRSERINRGQEQMRLTRQSSGLFPRKMSAANLLNALKPDRVADESSESESERSQQSTPAGKTLTIKSAEWRRNRSSSEGDPKVSSHVKKNDGPKSSGMGKGSPRSERKRSLRDFLLGRKKSKDDWLPESFTQLDQGSHQCHAFRLFLESVASLDLLELYYMLEKIDDASNWSQEELRIACEGVCARFLGLGDEPLLIPVEQSILTKIAARRARPDRNMFREVKESAMFSLSRHYANFSEDFAKHKEFSKSHPIPYTHEDKSDKNFRKSEPVRKAAKSVSFSLGMVEEKKSLKSPRKARSEVKLKK